MCFPLTQGLKKKLGTEELFLNFSFKTQKQMQTTIDGLTRREEANNRTVQQLREKQEQLQTTIDVLTKKLQRDVSKCKLVAVTPSK